MTQDQSGAPVSPLTDGEIREAEVRFEAALGTLTAEQRATIQEQIAFDPEGIRKMLWLESLLDQCRGMLQ